MEKCGMPLELVTVTTADGIDLDGAFYASTTAGADKPAAILMVHGLTWNFYRGPSRWLPPLLACTGYSCLSLNMRDHDLSEPKHFELAHQDLRAGVDHLAGQAAEVVLLAHGYACNKVVCYRAHSGDDRIRRRVLTTLGAVKAYRPAIWDQVISAAPMMAGETLVVQGATDHLIEARPRADALVRATTKGGIDVVLLEGANHYFDDRHEQLATCIVDWLDRNSEHQQRGIPAP